MVSFIIQVHQHLVGPMDLYNGSTGPNPYYYNSNVHVSQHMPCLYADHYHSRLLNEKFGGIITLLKWKF